MHVPGTLSHVTRSWHANGQMSLPETSARYRAVEPSSGSNVIPRRARPVLAGLGLYIRVASTVSVPVRTHNYSKSLCLSGTHNYYKVDMLCLLLFWEESQMCCACYKCRVCACCMGPLCDLSTTASQKFEVVSRRARIKGS